MKMTPADLNATAKSATPAQNFHMAIQSVTENVKEVLQYLQQENFTIVQLPVPQLIEDKAEYVVICFVYMSLCLVGLLGNTGISAIIIHILKTQSPVSSCKQTCIYILGLCLADSLLLFSTPLFVLQVLLNNWLFNQALCRVYLALETITKLLSTFILTALSVDRYLAIKSPSYGSVRLQRQAVLAILLSFALSTLLLLPLPLNAKVKPDYRLLNAIGPNTAVVFVARQCIVDMSEKVHKLFNGYTFVIGFCLPALIISYCYIRVFTLAKSHSLRLGHQSAIPLRRVFRYTVMVVCFYFFCNSPYWLLNVSFMFYDSSNFITDYPQMKIVNYVIHILPYINSAFNWVFYALLNSQLRELATEATTMGKASRALSIANNLSLRHQASKSGDDLANDYEKFCLSRQTTGDDGCDGIEISTAVLTAVKFKPQKANSVRCTVSPSASIKEIKETYYNRRCSEARL